MKEGIHPNYQETTITCACGNVFTTNSTKKDMKVDSCSKCMLLEFSDDDDNDDHDDNGGGLWFCRTL